MKLLIFFLQMKVSSSNTHIYIFLFKALKIFLEWQWKIGRTLRVWLQWNKIQQQVYYQMKKNNKRIAPCFISQGLDVYKWPYCKILHMKTNWTVFLWKISYTFLVRTIFPQLNLCSCPCHFTSGILKPIPHHLSQPSLQSV